MPLTVFLTLTQSLSAQNLRITSPKDGSVVYSGRDLEVTVEADPSVFRSVTIMGLPGIPPVLTSPPYRFSIPVPSGTPSGPNSSFVALGVPRSGGSPVYSSVRVDVERAETPERLKLGLENVSFRFVGEEALMNVTGVFADGSLTGLEYSTYTTYSSDAPSVATVDARGDVTAVAPGNANITITYTAPSGKVLSAKVPATVPVPIVVLPKTSSVYPSQSEELAVTLAINPDLDQSVEWSLSPQLGHIDENGIYTAPDSVASRQKVIVKARCVADPTKSASAEVWILPRQK